MNLIKQYIKYFLISLGNIYIFTSLVLYISILMVPFWWWKRMVKLIKKTVEYILVTLGIFFLIGLWLFNPNSDYCEENPGDIFFCD